MKVEAATLAGGEVTQDRYIVGPSFAAVLDGASSFGDNPSKYDGGWYAEQLASRLKTLLTDRPDDDTADLVADAITDIRDTYSLDPATSPTSTLALVRWNADTIECYCLGDSTIVLIHTDGTETIITDDRIKQFGADLREKYRADLRAGGGFGERHRATLAALQAEQAKYRNVDGGYWIAGAEPSTAHHAILNREPSRRLRSVILATDGVALERNSRVHAWRQLSDQNLPNTKVLQQINNAERTDREGVTWPRSKRHDDKTVVILSLAQLAPRS